MPSLMNGLSAMGGAMSAFAGTAGLEQQKADLAKQGMVLADQLATTREHVGRVESADIATAAAAAQHGYAMEQGAQAGGFQIQATKISAGATVSAAGIAAAASNFRTATQSADLKTQLAAAADLAEKGHIFDAQQQAGRIASGEKIAELGRQTQIGVAGIDAAARKYSTDTQSGEYYAGLAQAAPSAAADTMLKTQQTALLAAQTGIQTELSGLHNQLSSEQGKPTPDPAKINSITNQIVAMETSAGTQAAIVQAAAGMYRTDLDNVTQLNTRIEAATAHLNSPEMEEGAKGAQRAMIQQLQVQLAGAQRALEYSSDLIHGRVAAATNTPAPGTGPKGPLDLNKFLKTPGGTAAPGTAPDTGLINGAP